LLKKQNVGRPENEVQRQAFLQTCNFLEKNNEEQLTLSDLVEEMGKNLEGRTMTAYGKQYMKKRLLEHFGDGILICEDEGKAAVVTLRETAEMNSSNVTRSQKQVILIYQMNYKISESGR
jgi:hypothetical protein